MQQHPAERSWISRRRDKFVTVIIDLTPIREDSGPALLLDMVQGRSKAAFKTATSEELPDAVAVMDPYRIVRLA